MRALGGWLLAWALAPAWASHPLLTEDTELIELGQWELEVHAERSRDQSSEIAVKLARGLAQRLQLELELPYLTESAAGEAAQGRGDATVSLKWRFYESKGLSFAFKPDLIVPTGRDEQGLGAGRTGWAANLTAAYHIGRGELLAHLSYMDNRNRIGERESLRHASAALRWAATDELKLVVDLARETQPAPDRAAARELVLGATYALRENVDLGFGVKEGLHDAAHDRSVRVGVKLRF